MNTIDFKIRFKSKISHLSKEGILANIHTSSPILKSSFNSSKKQLFSPDINISHSDESQLNNLKYNIDRKNNFLPNIKEKEKDKKIIFPQKKSGFHSQQNSPTYFRRLEQKSTEDENKNLPKIQNQKNYMRLYKEKTRNKSPFIENAKNYIITGSDYNNKEKKNEKNINELKELGNEIEKILFKLKEISDRENKKH